MSRPQASIRHLRAPEPLDFPSEAEVPEEKEHFALRAHLFDIAVRAFGAYATIGSDQFVYWNGRSPARCLAPDLFIYWGTPESSFRSWKTWERGTPQTAVEIVSVFDRIGGPLEEKLVRYKELGVSELVRLDADAGPGRRLRIWDRVDDDLVEREIHGDASVAASLSGRHPDYPELFWVAIPAPRHPMALRLAEDAAGTRLLLTGEEAERRGREEERRAHDAERGARQEAERRVADLEAEIARLRAEKGTPKP